MMLAHDSSTYFALVCLAWFVMVLVSALMSASCLERMLMVCSSCCALSLFSWQLLFTAPRCFATIPMS